jgi:nitrate/TMAO reductase-like tetraheme cytochrome c subunit
MARRNPLEKVPDRIIEHFKRNLESIKNFKAVPFGEEEVTPREFRSRFANMSESDRKQVLDKNGQAEILRQLKGG